jgi:hypothetical protein
MFQETHNLHSNLQGLQRTFSNGKRGFLCKMNISKIDPFHDTRNTRVRECPPAECTCAVAATGGRRFFTDCAAASAGGRWFSQTLRWWLRADCPRACPFSGICGLFVRVRARSPDPGDFLSECAPVLRISCTFRPRARPFSGFRGLFVRVRARSPDFADFSSACAPVLRISRTFCPRARPLNHVKRTFSGCKIT